MILEAGNTWLLLVVSLPTQGATARMRIWRTLEANGCMALRDGAYLLPSGAQREQVLQDKADECVHEGGSAWLMKVQPRSAGEDSAYRELFDRSEDYTELHKAWKEANRGLSSSMVASSRSTTGSMTGSSSTPWPMSTRSCRASAGMPCTCATAPRSPPIRRTLACTRARCRPMRLA